MKTSSSFVARMVLQLMLLSAFLPTLNVSAGNRTVGAVGFQSKAMEGISEWAWVVFEVRATNPGQGNMLVQLDESRLLRIVFTSALIPGVSGPSSASMSGEIIRDSDGVLTGLPCYCYVIDSGKPRGDGDVLALVVLSSDYPPQVVYVVAGAVAKGNLMVRLAD